MDNPAVFKSAEIVLGNLTNSALTTYDFKIVSSTAIYPFDFILITFPEVIGLPSENISCQSSTTKQSLAPIVCSRSEHEPNSVMIDNSNGAKILALEAFMIRIDNVMNPNTTKPTSPIKVVVYDSVQLSRPTAKDPENLIVTTVIPFTVSS